VLWLTVLLWIATLVNLAAVAVVDLKRRIIPNELVLAALGAGIALRLISPSGMLWLSALAAAGIFLVLGTIAHFGAIGGGDVKLIPAVSLLAPANQVLPLLLDIAIAGGVLSIAYLVARAAAKVPPLLRTDFADVQPSNAGKALARAGFNDSVPYGLAVCAGIAFYFADEALRCLYATSCSL
jgi:prepilin peptidase CpaA